MQNIDSDLIRGNIDTIILKTMLNEDKYGLDIIKEVEQRSNGTYELKQPTLYSCLKRLENQELISSYWLNSDIGGRRHYYKLTDKGRDFYNKKQEEWAKSKFVIDNLLSNYNYEEYRLVKKDDYDKAIGLAAASNDSDLNNPQEVSSDPQFFEDNADDESTYNFKEDNEDESEDAKGLDIEENSDDEPYKSNESDEDSMFDFNNDEDKTEDDQTDNYYPTSFEESEENEEEFEKSETEDEELVDFNSELEDEDFYEEDEKDESTMVYVSNSYETDKDNEDKPNEMPSYELPDQSQNESNILDMLRRQQKEEINTYEGDKKSYANHIKSIYDDVKYVQDDMVFGAGNEEDEVDQKIKEFTDAAQRLNEFENENESDDENLEEFDNIVTENLNETIENDDELENNEDNEDTETFESEESFEDNNFEEETEEYKPQDESEIETSSEIEQIFNTNEDKFDDNINEEPYFESNEFETYENDSSFFSSGDLYSNDTFDENNINLSESQDSDNEFELSSESQEDDILNYNDYSPSQFDSYSNGKFNKEAYDSTFVNVRKEPCDCPENNYDESSLENTDIDSIISKNASGLSEQKQSNNFFERRYINENYKQKLSNLSVYSKVSTEKVPKTKQNETAEVDDLDTLKLNFEREGIKVKEYKKITSYEEAEKTYLLTNKINMVKSLILLFGYMFILSGMYIILQKTSIGLSEDFALTYFLYGIIPFAIIALYNTVIYFINPYKKIPARFASRIMIFLAVIVTVQLLLITYCVNLQLGFYSFTQAGYNHLLWIIPSAISFGPIISNLIYLALFHSGNFKV